MAGEVWRGGPTVDAVTSTSPRVIALRRDVGARLGQVRAEAGLSLAQLAEATGRSRTYLSEVERGNRLPSLDTVLLWAGGCGRTVLDVLSAVSAFATTSSTRSAP